MLKAYCFQMKMPIVIPDINMVSTPFKKKPIVPKVSSKVDDDKKCNPSISLNIPDAPKLTSKTVNSIKSLHDITYFDGMGELRIGSDDVWANMFLLDEGIIEAFIIDWMDYSDIHTLDEVLDLVKYDNHKHEWKKQFVLFPTEHGILVTNKETWIINELCLEVKDSMDEYQVSHISKDRLSELTCPSEIIDDMLELFDGNVSLRGDRYTMYIRWKDNNSIVFRKLDDSIEFAHLFNDFISSYLPDDYTTSIYDESTQKDVVGVTTRTSYGEGILDPNLDIEKYFDTLTEENKELYDNKRIYLLIRSKC